VILAALSTFLFLYTKVRWSLLYLFGVPLVYTLLAPWAFNNLNLIFDMVHPYLVILSSFAAVYIYRYVTEFKEKLALKGAFSKYVNPEIVKQITEHPENLHLGGTKLPVTVLFTDIAHFTTISENLTPESLVALLNEYFDAMSEVILAQGGTLDKFEGDAIMAFFGAPIHYPDHAIRAANAAVGMRHKLNELLKKWASDAPLPGGEKKPVIDFRCGLSSGDVIVGNVGSKERFEYTVMGDIVNLGSRLEGANKKYSTNTMVSEATYLLIKDSFEGRELDTIRVVGKNKPIKVYEILSHKGELPADAMSLLQSYNEGITLYHSRKYAEGLEKFKQILQKFPADGPSKMYVQRCEVLRDFPRPADWDEVFEMGSK
jgi:adenylate cyclase